MYIHIYLQTYAQPILELELYGHARSMGDLRHKAEKVIVPRRRAVCGF